MKKYFDGDYINSVVEQELVVDLVELVKKSSDTGELYKEIMYNFIGPLVSGYNAYKGVDVFLNKQMKKRWEKSSQKVIDHGNYGWDTCVTQLLQDMSDELGE
jgi:hypothetical protein